MFHGNGENSYWGMHLIWWILWILFLVWIFATPYSVPGQKRKKEDPFEILKRRYAAGEIDTQEYEERKKILERDSKKNVIE